MKRFRYLLLAAAAMTFGLTWGQDIEEPESKRIETHRYWFDNDASTKVDESAKVTTVNIADLPMGLHTFTMQVKDSEGQWSSTVTKYFVKKPTPTTTEIAACEYWFDDDVENFQVVEPAGPQGIVPVDVSALTAGEHTIYWRVGDSKGTFSQQVGSSLFRYTVPASGVGTFSAADNMAMGDGLKAYYATYLKETKTGLGIKVVDSGSKVVPAETGVLLSGTAGDTYTMVPTDEEATANADNRLVAVVESRHVNATDGEYVNYMLQSGKFVKILDEDESVKMPAHRAYLPLLSAETANANAVDFIWEDDTATSLDGIRADGSSDGTIYNLQGQKVETPTRGIYIINGKKVIVK